MSRLKPKKILIEDYLPQSIQLIKEVIRELFSGNWCGIRVESDNRFYPFV